MDDLIRRRDAIDVVCGLDRSFVQYIEDIPSAQPELRCDTCRYRNLEWHEEPCDSCTQGGETNHYKPSAQPERKKGEWIIRNNHGTGWYRVTCSECGEDVTSEIPIIGFFPNAKPIWDYCPYCGSDNREESDND